ncbi:MAG: alpha/beta hydrolase [Prevotellaceae bacterium]|jgi:pimeloyl-ACP methyl ester carboxylesterase|nr:alpha/beta hydrolase [Prevotellaceae bacterium]
MYKFQNINKLTAIFLFIFAINLHSANAQEIRILQGNDSIYNDKNQTCKFNHQAGKYLEIDGANIYYEEIENRGKPVLLFLHGGFGNIESFNDIIPLFCNDFHIIGIDSRGHGKSTLGTDNLTYKRLQIDAEVIVNQLQVTNVNIIGYSDGGIVAYRIAAANKILINKLITIGATWSLQDAATAEEIVADMTIANSKETFAEYYKYYQANNPNPEWDKFVKLCLEMWIDKTESGYPYKNIRSINVPTLIIRGNNDKFLSLESAVELSKKIEKSLLLNIPFASHGAFKSHPQIFEIIAKQFLNK